MTRRWLSAPRPPDERGTLEQRPYLLWLPRSEPPWPAMVILHGAGSQKENHADFARLCAASGWLALCFDQRGHGDSAEEMTPAAIGDVGTVARRLADRTDVDASRVCVRGSSMGGFMAIHGAAVEPLIAGVIAICPAGEEQLRRGLRDRSLEMRISERSRGDLDAWLAEHDLREASAALGARPLILLHARGDERIPYRFSQELFDAAAAPRKLILLPGGHHRSVQHDAELQAAALRWLERNL